MTSDENVSDLYSEDDIHQNTIATCIDSWICPIVEKYINKAKFHPSDFIGTRSDSVSVNDMVVSMMFYAFKDGIRGDDQHWDEDCYNEFKNRVKVFDKLLKRVESMATKNGQMKISSIKKMIRMEIESRERENKKQIDTLGLFVDHQSMADILSIERPIEFVQSMQILGSLPEKDPGYYIHSIFRFHMHDLHQTLVSNEKVIRFPSMQRILDIINPVSIQTCLPSEFREFMKKIGSSSMPVVSLPLPAKDGGNSVVYGYKFEDLQWVQATRQKISNKFSEWKTMDSMAYDDIYPSYLKMGDAGNKMIAETMARSMEMDELQRNLDLLKKVNMDQLRKIIQEFPHVVDIHTGYKNNHFSTAGEQLRERRGYFMHPDIRGVFNKIFKKFPAFFADIHKTMNISHDIAEELDVFFRIKKIMTFSSNDHELWRTFVLAVEKVCLAFYVCSREDEVKTFFSTYESSDKYVAHVVNK